MVIMPVPDEDVGDESAIALPEPSRLSKAAWILTASGLYLAWLSVPASGSVTYWMAEVVWPLTLIKNTPDRLPVKLSVCTSLWPRTGLALLTTLAVVCGYEMMA